MAKVTALPGEVAEATTPDSALARICSEDRETLIAALSVALADWPRWSGPPHDLIGRAVVLQGRLMSHR